MTTPSSSVQGPPTASRGRRPNPRIAQMRRTFYFLSRNTLAMVGLGIIIFFVCVAIYSFSYHASSTTLNQYCGTYNGPGGGSINISGACISVCTYPNNEPAPQPNCYAVDPNNPGFVAPTVNLLHLSGGPVPLGSLSTSSGPYFFSIYQGFVKGAPWSLGISSGIVVSGALIGLTLGSVAGYFGGWTDTLLVRLTELFQTVPTFLLVIVIVAIGQPSAPVIALAIGVAAWPTVARLVRAQFRFLREAEFIAAARSLGYAAPRIIFHEILPNALAPIIVTASVMVANAILTEAGLSFLNMGDPNLISWGSMIGDGRPLLRTAWFLCALPGGAIALTVLSLNLVGDGLNDVLNPRSGAA